MAEKERLDILLVQRNLAQSRELAKAYIMAGNVYVDGCKESKAGTSIHSTAQIEVRNVSQKYVSRGGYKLEKAMDVFGIQLTDKICLDIGASTGGFTDCMLQNAAAYVYAIDVGYGQFAWKLRNDPRVLCLEKTNVRYISEEQITKKGDFASIDVSFISLTKVLPAVLSVLKDEGQLVCLIKPQFEAGREKVGKKGVVKDISVHLEVIVKIIDFAILSNVSVMDISFSPIKGPEGNIEYLIYLDKIQEGMTREAACALAEEITDASHELL